MGHGVFRSAFILVVVCMAINAPWAHGLVAMDNGEMDRVSASTGVAIGLENLSIKRQWQMLGFSPDGDKTRSLIYGKDLSANLSFPKSRATLKATKLGVGPGRWFLEDHAKLRFGGLGSYVYRVLSKDYEIENPTIHLNSRAPSGVVLTLDGENGGPALAQSISGKVGFLAPDHINPANRLDVATGQIQVTGANMLSMRMTLYPHGDISGYTYGEGVALELAVKQSIESVQVKDNNGNALVTLRGIHMRESFDNQGLESGGYLKWGGMTKNYFSQSAPLSDYAKSTGDPDGWHGAAYTGATIPGAVIRAPYTGGPGPKNMYGGYFLHGNLAQVGFADRTGGKRVEANHGQMTGHDTISSNSFSGLGLTKKLDDDYQLRSQSAANAIALEERPVTISVRSGRYIDRWDSGTQTLKTILDKSSYIAIHWPRHGSIRIEEIEGYSSGVTPPYGNTMGSVIIDGMRSKWHYIEFPGREAHYTYDQQNNHTYVYVAGRMHDHTNINGIPTGQAAWDPMGRGQLWFMNHLGKTTNNGGAYDVPGWDQYMVTRTISGTEFACMRLIEPPMPSNPRWYPDTR